MSTTTIDATSQRAAWLAWRRGGIGGSDVAGILNISPYSSPYSVWANKMGWGTDDEATEAMEMGLDLEPVVAKRFHRETGLYVAGAQTWCSHPDVPWAQVTVDGFVVESPASSIEDAIGVHESKSTADSPKKWDDGIPAHYAAQGQWSMFVTGHERVWFGVFHASYGLRFRVYELARDEDDIALIVQRCEAFWFDHVLADVPPPTDGHPATTEALKTILARPGDVVELGLDVGEQVARLEGLKEARKVIDADIDEISNWLRAVLGEATEGHVLGQPRFSWRPQDTARIDVDLLRARYPRAAARLTKKTTSRVLRLHKLKED